jgi:putative transposase
MATGYISPLPALRPSRHRRLYEAQREAARVWIVCRARHLAARRQPTRWPEREDLQRATKGPFALHSQRVQMICHPFLATVDTAHDLRQTPRQMRSPSKEKTC